MDFVVSKIVVKNKITILLILQLFNVLIIQFLFVILFLFIA